MNNTIKIKGLISSRMYTFADLAVVLQVHIRTVQAWHKRGLKVTCEQTRPLLVRGIDVITFLSDRRSTRRCKLENDEFYCLACKSPRKAEPGSSSDVLTGRKLGGREPQLLITGICPVCNRRMSKLTKKISGGEK